MTTPRTWVYVRDDWPFGGPDPPAAVFHHPRDADRSQTLIVTTCGGRVCQILLNTGR